MAVAGARGSRSFCSDPKGRQKLRRAGGTQEWEGVNERARLSRLLAGESDGRKCIPLPEAGHRHFVFVLPVCSVLIPSSLPPFGADCQDRGVRLFLLWGQTVWSVCTRSLRVFSHALPFDPVCG